MKLIIPSVEIWQQNNSIDGIWAHIARCTRVCYQTTPKNDNEDDETYVRRVLLHSSTGEVDFNKIHGAMLEHGTVYLKDEFFGNPNDTSYLDKYKDNKYSRYYKCAKVLPNRCCTYITTNLRVIYENNWLNDLQYICSPTEFHHRRVTVSFITNIGVSREFNRHRVNSIAEESTRYCNYSKKNDGQLNIGLPAWLLDDEHLPYLNAHRLDSISEYSEELLAYTDDELLNKWCDIDFYLCAITFSQWCYNMLIKKGWTAQKAREVLPLATKTQLIHTAFVDDWIHFLKLRYKGVSGAPHPNAKYVAEPLYKQMVAYNLIPKDI